MIPFRTDLPPVVTLQVARLCAGSAVIYQGRQRTVASVVLRGYDLHLVLEGGEEVHEDVVQPIIDSVPMHQRAHQYWNKEPRKGELSTAGSSSPAVG